MTTQTILNSHTETDHKSRDDCPFESSEIGQINVIIVVEVEVMPTGKLRTVNGPIR